MRTLQTTGMLTILAATFAAAACAELKPPTAPSAAALGAERSTQVSGANAAELSAVRQATAAFHDVDTAIAAGYASPVGGTVTKALPAPWGSTVRTRSCC